jgi:hypothetical protein
MMVGFWPRRERERWEGRWGWLVYYWTGVRGRGWGEEGCRGMRRYIVIRNEFHDIRTFVCVLLF